jgi:hypothetical protein
MQLRVQTDLGENHTIVKRLKFRPNEFTGQVNLSLGAVHEPQPDRVARLGNVHL